MNIYLAVIIDLYSRKCIGWDLSRNIGSHLTINALDTALKRSCAQAGLTRDGWEL